MLPYDPTQDALYRPQLGETVFDSGAAKLANEMCAELARLAYIQFEDDANKMKALKSALAAGGLGAPVLFSTPGTSTEGFLAVSSDGKNAFVVFRGTESDDPTDLSSDIHFSLAPWAAGGKVHGGFLTALDSVWEKVDTALKACSADKVWFTGHSLGAALATLAVQRAGRPNSELVTFGSPRVGDSAFAALFKDLAVKRYVGCCDVVTKLPPESLGYAHVAQHEYIDRNGLLQEPPLSEALIAKDRWDGWLEYEVNHAWKWGNVGARNLADHAPANYIRVFYP
jgi:pimeloyl-ACP methyl ester carboxylesterase